MEPFTIIEPYKILVCTSCCYGCPLHEIQTHLRNKHRNLSPTQRNAIVRESQRHSSLFKDQEELEFFTLPNIPIPVIPQLAGPFFDGLKCNQCSYIARQIRLIQEHCRTKHSWVNARKSGGRTSQKSNPPPSNPWTSGVRCQRFFPNRRASQWFEVILLES
jgi:hypothetical protein